MIVRPFSTRPSIRPSVHPYNRKSACPSVHRPSVNILKQDIQTLIQRRVPHARFDDLDGVIFEVEIDLHATYSVLVDAALGDRLLKVRVEGEDLLVEDDPRRQVEHAGAARNERRRRRDELRRTALGADARLRFAGVLEVAFGLVEVMRLVEPGLSQLSDARRIQNTQSRTHSYGVQLPQFEIGNFIRRETFTGDKRLNYSFVGDPRRHESLNCIRQRATSREI